MTSLAARLMPALTVSILAVLAVLPWGLPADARFVLPFLPVIALHDWSSRHADRLSPWVPFAAGIVVDVLTNGPLGYWPLIYLGAMMLGADAQRMPGAGPAARWVVFLAALVGLVIAAWGVASLYHLSVSDWRPFAWALWVSALCYPPLAFVLRALDPVPLRPSNDRMVRGV
jgi:rod shape-determining protein MreD